MRHFTLHMTPRTTSPAVVCKTREFSVVARSRFSCDHRKVPAVQGEPKLVRGLRAPPRGLSGGPLWSLHPDAASQRIRSAGLSSRHLNQRSHKLCSASLGGLLDTASLDGPPALAETSAGAPAQAALRGKPSLPACDPLLVSSSTDWAEPGEGPGSVWGTACRGDAPVRGLEGVLTEDRGGCGPQVTPSEPKRGASAEGGEERAAAERAQRESRAEHPTPALHARSLGGRVTVVITVVTMIVVVMVMTVVNDKGSDDDEDDFGYAVDFNCDDGYDKLGPGSELNLLVWGHPWKELSTAPPRSEAGPQQGAGPEGLGGTGPRAPPGQHAPCSRTQCVERPRVAVTARGHPALPISPESRVLPDLGGPHLLRQEGSCQGPHSSGLCISVGN
ncbi:unnamed protein product [Rangifer tarandus platyrhynchus]|uniref:Uncharacterized protein n=1 Tax=Rangifer tarandus platyrhynchus TaxID=3082113 RepID=A0ABN8Y4X8_RANTA|nr:unnamed protein product [Rangifer tarandus platyrhynchus]